MFYVYAEDMASAIVGPFESQDDAEKHIQFCQERGDGADMEVVVGSESAPFGAYENDPRTIDQLRLADDFAGIVMTAEEDINWEV